LSYDEATRTVAGDLGTDDACQSILDGVSSPSYPFQSIPASNGSGCVVADSTSRDLLRIRITYTPTISNARLAASRRVCACK
jgi:hypothetical protein